jgi:hypothetical protein
VTTEAGEASPVVNGLLIPVVMGEGGGTGAATPVVSGIGTAFVVNGDAACVVSGAGA